MSAPAAPVQLDPPPRVPSFARWMRAKRYSTSVLMLRSARAQMLPPRHVLLAAKVRRAGAALAGVHLDLGFVDEFHGYK
jgi:hypothetical protein